MEGRTPRLVREPFTEEEIIQLREDFQPVLDKIKELKKKYRIESETLSVYGWLDGTMSIGGDALMGWTVMINEDGNTKLRYNYETDVEEGEKA